MIDLACQFYGFADVFVRDSLLLKRSFKIASTSRKMCLAFSLLDKLILTSVTF